MLMRRRLCVLGLILPLISRMYSTIVWLLTCIVPGQKGTQYGHKRMHSTQAFLVHWPHCIKVDTPVVYWD